MQCEILTADAGNKILSVIPRRQRQNESKMVMILVVGLIFLLATIVIGDFYIAITESRPPDESVIRLLEHAIIGIVSLCAGYIAGKDNES